MTNFDLTEIGTWVLDTSSGMVVGDDSLFNIFGLEASPSVRPLADFIAVIHPEDRERVDEAIEAAVLSGSHQYRAEYRVVRSDDVRRVVARGFIERDDDGQPLRFPGLVVDTTERHRAELALSAEKSVLEMIADGAPVREVLESVALSIEAQSSAGGRACFLTLDSSQTLGRCAGPSLPDEHLEAIDELCLTLEDLPESRGETQVWPSLARLARERGWIAADVVIVRASKGEELGALVVHYPGTYAVSAEDQQLKTIAVHLAGIVLERARTEQALQLRADQFTLLANSLPQMAWMAEPDGYIFWFNKRWYEYTGTSEEEMKGWGWRKVHHPEWLEEVVAEWSGCVRAGQPFRKEFPIRGASGRFRMFLTQVEPLKGPDGQVTRWFGTHTDVEELRVYREERERLLETEERSRREATQLSVQLLEERDKLRDERETQARLVHLLRSANRSASQMSLARTPQELTEILWNLLVSTLDARAAGIWHASNNPNILELVGSHQLDDSSPMLAHTLDVRYNSYKPGWVARYGQPFAGLVDPRDLQLDQEWLRRAGVRYAAIYPLLARTRVVGVMAFFGGEELPVVMPEVLATVAGVYGNHLVASSQDRQEA